MIKFLSLCSSVLLMLSVIGTAFPVLAAEHFVDTDSIGGPCDDAGPGTMAAPWCSMGQANASVEPGSTVFIRAGTYPETIRPALSGTADGRISFVGYGSEDAKISVVDGDGANLNAKSYITLARLHFDGNSKHSVDAISGSHYLEVSNCLIEHTSPGKYYNLQVHESDYAHIHHNTFQHPNRAASEEEERNHLGLAHAQFALVENNVFFDAPGHGMLETSYSSYNVLRRNTFASTGEYTANNNEVVDDMLELLKQSHHNLIEENLFYESGDNFGDGRTHTFKYQNSSYNIARRNLAYDTDGRFFHIYTSSNSPPAESIHNAAYHNSVHNYCFSLCNHVRDAGFTVTGRDLPGARFNQYLNNIFHTSGSNGLVAYPEDLTGDPPSYIGDNLFRRNLIANITLSDVMRWGSGYTLESAEVTYPENFADNERAGEQVSVFADPASNDYSLHSQSPAIDSGGWLTRITSPTGAGTSFDVSDPQFFTDGKGIIPGDLIQLEGDSARVRVTNVHSDTITVDSAISWSNGQGVALAYNGHAPDLGAVEFGEEPCFGATCETLQLQTCADQGGVCCVEGEHCSNSATPIEASDCPICCPTANPCESDLPPQTVFSQVDYYGDRLNYEELTPAHWTVLDDGGDPAYALVSTGHSPSEGVLGEYALIKDRSFGDFVMTMQARSSEDLSQNDKADFGIIFGWVDAANYCYIQLNSTPEFNLVICRTDGVDEELMALPATDPALIQDDDWHQIQLERVGAEIILRVDETNNVMALGPDARLDQTGQVGIGSQNDAARFDDIELIEPTETFTDPVVSVSANVYSGEAPLTVRFTGEASDPDGGLIASWSWDFGDENGSNDQNPVHEYTSSGHYVATLTVTDDEGARGSASVTLEVLAPGPASTGCDCTVTSMSFEGLWVVWLLAMMMGLRRRYPQSSSRNS